MLHCCMRMPVLCHATLAVSAYRQCCLHDITMHWMTVAECFTNFAVVNAVQSHDPRQRYTSCAESSFGTGSAYSQPWFGQKTSATYHRQRSHVMFCTTYTRICHYCLEDMMQLERGAALRHAVLMLRHIFSDYKPDQCLLWTTTGFSPKTFTIVYCCWCNSHVR